MECAWIFKQKSTSGRTDITLNLEKAKSRMLEPYGLATSRVHKNCLIGPESLCSAYFFCSSALQAFSKGERIKVGKWVLNPIYYSVPKVEIIRHPAHIHHLALIGYSCSFQK